MNSECIQKYAHTNYFALTALAKCVKNAEILSSLLLLDMDSLESILRESVVQGQSRTHRPYKKILIIVEGVYRLVWLVQNQVAKFLGL